MRIFSRLANIKWLPVPTIKKDQILAEIGSWPNCNRMSSYLFKLATLYKLAYEPRAEEEKTTSNYFGTKIQTL